MDEVIRLHDFSIERHGGAHGIRDLGLITSATLAAAQTFGGEFLCKTIEDMAATYWCNLAQNHGFLDGNKRTGVIAAIAFLERNGLTLNVGDEELYEVAMLVAERGISKDAVAQFIARHLITLDP